MSVIAGEPFLLGPGVLKIGQTGTEVDVSCLVNNAVIAADKEQGDDTTKLCGTVRKGSVKYTYSLSGNMDTDLGEATGFFALSQTQAGKELDFTFTPSTEALTTATGKLVVDPLDFGGDTTGETMTSDFEFAIVGPPTYDYDGGVMGDTPALDQAQADQDDDQPDQEPAA
jgi:hypothetical protein